MNLGDKILKIRKDNKMSQEQFSEMLNVTRQTVSNWENGKNYPDIETLIIISDKFNVSLDILLKGDKEMIKDINKKTKNNKALKIIIAVLIAIIVLFVGLKIYETVDYYLEINDIDKDNPPLALTMNKCNYNGKRLRLNAIIEQDCNYEYKKWYEVPSCTSDYNKKPIAFSIIDNETKEQDKELMENSNINVEDYDSANDLLTAEENYIISIGGTCDNR